MPDRALAYAEAIDQAATGETTPEDLLGFLAKDINDRLTAQEERALEVQRIADTIAAEIAASVLVGLQDQIARIEAAADLGQLFEAASASTLTVATGEVTLVVADADKPRFSAPGWILLTATDEDDVWMLGRRVSYDRPSGLLVVDVDRVAGLGETASAWSIAAASEGAVPTASDGDYSADEIVVSPTVLGENRVQAVLAALVTALAAKAPLADAALTGTPTAPTATLGTDTTQIATTAFVKAAVDALLGGTPGALDTLNELAEALGDDANFAATVTTALAGKQPLAAALTTLAALASVANLSALAGLTGAADKGIRFTGAGTMALVDQKSGEWTPTCTGITNTDANPIANPCRYVREGNIVSVSGLISVDPTAAGNTTFRFTLPIASSFADAAGATGAVSTGGAASSVSGSLYSNAANDELEISFRAGSGSGHLISFSGHYTIA